LTDDVPVPRPEAQEEEGAREEPDKEVHEKKAPRRIRSTTEEPRRSPLRIVFPLAGILIGGGAAYWYFGGHGTSPSGSGGTAPALSPEEAHREIVRLSGEGRVLMDKGDYQDSVKVFSKVLDLDPSNMEAKDQLDKAASKILEQKRLEEDVQTAKEFFVEKDY